MSRDSAVQSIVRVIRVIEVLNDAPVTPLNVLHRATELPKPTLIRLLETLIREGYVFHVSRREGYALTDKILRMSAGFRYSDALVDVARPILEAFTHCHKWHISLGTFDADAMHVRFNTKKISPFAIDQIGLNARGSVLSTALGRAYLAYCTPSERRIIVKMLKASDDPVDALARDDASLDAMITTIRRQGYATIDRPHTSRIRSFAVPILRPNSGDVLGTLAMVYFKSAMTEAQALRSYLEEVYDLGRQIAAGVEYHT